MSVPLRVLIVEDAADDAALMAMHLTAAGFQPQWTQVQTEAAYRAALETRPDLILADWALSQFSGLAALRIARERDQELPFIIVSGSIGEETAIDALRQGAQDYVSKDRPARLGQAVRRALAERQDRSARRQAEESLRESEAYFCAFVNAISDLIALKDHELRYVIVNQAMAAFLQRPPAEIVGRTDADLLPAGLAMQCQVSDRRVLASGTISVAEETSADRVFESTKFPVPFTDGRIGVGMVIHDITERKRLDEKLRQTLESLADSNADLERFAYVVSHDLQEPLRMVSSFVQLLAERYRGRLAADADEFIGFAVDGAQRMSQLINDLLTYSRLGTRGHAPQPTNTEDILQEALWNLNVAIQEAGAVVTHDPMPTVSADPTQLLQLFQNLIGNALKFRSSQPAQIHVTAKRQDTEDARPDGEHPHPPRVAHPTARWLFSVRDNGIGIAPEHHDRIFDVFQRLHLHTEYPGTGIGLAICKRVVERHGGRIWVESQVGHGTTFYFTLPAAAETA